MSKTRNIQLKNAYHPEYKLHIELSYSPSDCSLVDALEDAIYDIIDANRGNGWDIEEDLELKVEE